MKNYLELIPLSPTPGDAVNYNLLLFRLKVPASLDLKSSTESLVIMKALIAGGAKKILMDMTGLETVDSAGIGTLISAAKSMKTAKGEVVFSGVSQSIKNVFRMVNLQGFIKIFNLEAEAVNYFRYL